MSGITTLYRPVGQAERDLIQSSGRLLPRLPFQPIFYPVATYAYAEKIARDWNTVDPASGFAGYVTEFDVDTEYVNSFEIQTVGSSDHLEYWIPAEAMRTFNSMIMGPIRVVAEFRGGR